MEAIEVQSEKIAYFSQNLSFVGYPSPEKSANDLKYLQLEYTREMKKCQLKTTSRFKGPESRLKGHYAI